jgi:uncharacterized membrane protein YphA (DoxX/SURF4 family)
MQFSRKNTVEILSVAMRWFLGGLFIYMGMVKALHPEHFLKLVRDYHMVGSPYVLNVIAAALPWFEVFCGVLLLAGIAVRGTALMLILMLVPFTIAIFRRALEMAGSQLIPFCAVRFDCGCGAGEVLICRKLAENFFLLLFAILLLAGMGRRWCVRYSLFLAAGQSEPASAPELAKTVAPATQSRQ